VLRFTLRLSLIASLASAALVLGAALLGRFLDYPQLTLLARFQVISHLDLNLGLRVTLDSYADGFPILLRWSPDGRWLTYILDTLEGDDHLRLIDARAGRTRLLASGVGGDAPSWSADSQRLAVLLESGTLCIIRVTDGAQVCVDDGYPRGAGIWSPVGSQLAQTRIADGAVRLEIHEDGRAPRELARFFSVERLLWTPDGRALLVYGRADRDANPLLHRVDTSSGAAWILAADILRVGEYQADGRLQVLSVGDTRTLYALDTDSGDLEPVASIAPFWGSSLPLDSPDGAWQALAGSTGSRPRLFLSRGAGWVDAGALFSTGALAWRP
jgi:dipeptidyl aminopeptidase/acylaminoacyl peptidase